MWCNATKVADNNKALQSNRNGQTMRKHRIVLKAHGIRKANAFLRNWANRTESDNLALLAESGIIMAKSGKAVLKGWNV